MENNQPGRRLSLSLTSVLLIIMTAVSLYFFIQYQQTKKLLTNPTEVAQSEIKKLVAQIGKLIELPSDETPSMATVTDKNKLANQTFFAKAQNGDKILLYQKNRKAILYRPSINKIIEVSLVSTSLVTPASIKITPTKIVERLSPTTTPAVVNKVKLVIYNGTKIIGLAGKKEDLILASMNNIDVITTGNAKNDYTENLVIDLKSGNNAVAEQIAKLISGKVTVLPEGETAPADADLLLIVGKE